MKQYRNLIGLLLAIMLAVALFNLNVPGPVCVSLVAAWQLMAFAQSKAYRRGQCFITALTPEQVTEFSRILDGVKGYDGMFKDLAELAKVEGGFAAIKGLPALLKTEQKRNDTLDAELKRVQKELLKNKRSTGVTYRRNADGREVPFVSDDCARAISSLYIMTCAQQGKWPATMRETSMQQRLLGEACEMLGVEQRAASSLSGTEIPLPTVYTPQVVELIWKYGQIRQFGTVFPLGAGTVILPRLKAGEDKFAYLGVGTAGMGQAVGKKQAALDSVTFTANKFGGIIAIPTELEEDTFIPLGQFLARYISRRFAYGEDDTAFNGDGTATYANIKGVGTYCNDGGALTYSIQLAAGKTKPSDATIADFRNMRLKVNAAAYFNSAYYLHPTMDALLVTFNTINNPRIYDRQPNGQATLDGFPVRWTGVAQPYSAAAAAAKDIAFFGDLSYVYLGERGAPRVQTSLDVYFTTDEIAMRAIERIDVEMMAIDAMSSLRTAAA